MEGITQQHYDEWNSDSEAFQKLDGEDQYRQFMVDHKYTEAETAEEVPQEDFDYFVEHSVPALSKPLDSRPAFEEWRETLADKSVQTVRAGISPIDALKESIAPLDIIFALLGIATAYKVVEGGEANT